MNENLPIYRDGFFEKFLAELPGAPNLAALEQQQPAGQPLTLLGQYVAHAGGAVTPLPAASITPQFAIQTGGEGAVQTYALLWVVERFDVATDPAATIARILADFRAPTSGTGGTSDADSMTSALAEEWSRALTVDAVRQALARNLGTITEVPAGVPATGIDELRAFLGHFGTYTADGTYYAKGTVTEGGFPAGVSTAYLAPEAGNLVEVRLQRDNFYCYALVSERLWNPQAPASRFRQLVFRIDDQGADAVERWRLALLHTVSANQGDAAAGSRFIFFDAPAGVGLPLPEGARTVVTTTTASLLEELPSRLENLQAALDDPDVPVVGSPDAPYVLLMGAVKEGFPRTPLPDGVIEDGTGFVRTFRCPPQHLRALAERDDLDQLVASTPVWLCMQHAAQEVHLAGRTFPAGITAANTGQGVLIGIVDGGIDGSHPAFLGRPDDPTKSRIHSVWNIWEHGGDSPYKRSGNKAPYESMKFGKEYIGHNEVITATDAGGHGTHVAGIAAGRSVGAWPGGISPAATIVVVGTSNGSFVNDVFVGVKYCFQKATELGLPCVVNISLATERHSHDGTDPLSISLTQLVSANQVPATGLGVLVSAMPNYINGRIICAAAGNWRNKATHWQTTIPAGGDVSLVYQPLLPGGGSGADGISFWAYNDDATTVRLRISTRHSTSAVLATAEVPLMISNGRVTTNLPNGLQVNIHNGPAAPNNRHFNPEVYWMTSAGSGAVPAGPWIVRLRNVSRAACTIHGFAAFREWKGRFVVNAAQTQPLIGVTYTPDQLRQFESHKVATPGTAPGCISVAAFTSEPGLSDPVGEIAPFSSPGPLRAAGPGRRAIDVALPGHRILSAQAGTGGVVAMSGTSMATPVMTGLVAALLQINPNLNTGDLRNKLEISATRRPTDTVDDWGLGRVDAVALLRA